MPFFLFLLLVSYRAIAGEPAWWTQQKSACGIARSTAYNTWVANGSPCPSKSGGKGGTSASDEIFKQAGAAIGTELVKGIMGDPEEKAREAKAAAERQRQAALRKAEFERQQEEQRKLDEEERELAKQRILSALKGSEPSSGGLQLKTETRKGAFGSNETAPMLEDSPTVGGLKLKVGDDPEHLAKGGRVVDCNHTREIYKRLSAGLPAQRQMLSKYREQIESGKKERGAISEEARSLAIKTAYDEARNISKSLDVVRSRLGKMKLQGMNLEKRKAWMRTLDESDKLYEKMDKLPSAAVAGAKYGEELPGISKNLGERASRLNKLLVDSGIAEQAGEELAKYGFGPVGALSFRVFKFGIESSYIMGKNILNEDEMAQAKSTYDNLEASYKSNEETVNNSKADLEEFCSN